MREQIDRERRLPLALIDAMRAARLFSLWLPRSLDGPELSMIDFLRIIEELARIDGSVAWCASIAGCHSRFAGYLQPDAAREIYGGGGTVVAGSVNPTGKAFATDGGYRVTGHWSYGSGILHSTWTIGACMVHDREGPRRGPSGAPEVRLVFFPTSAAEVIDTWRVVGLRGTGSHDYRVADLFVPEDHAILYPAPPPVQPGSFFALPLIFGLAFAIAAVPLGIARSAIDALIELAAAKTPTGGSTLLRDKPTIQADVGRAEALLGSARAYLLMTFNELCDEAAAGIAPTPQRRALMWLACAQAAQASAQAVDLMYAAAGGTSLYETNRLERCFRDVHACAQHIAISSTRYEPCGRVILGLDPGTPRF